MRYCQKRNAFYMIIFISFFSLFLLKSFLPAVALAADGDGIIEPGEDATEELARSAQNPITSMISLPFQNNTNFNFGPQKETQNVLNIQPVLPFELTDNWNLITRTIVPLISQPKTAPGTEREFGVGDTFFTAFYRQRIRGNGFGVQDQPSFFPQQTMTI